MEAQEGKATIINCRQYVCCIVLKKEKKKKNRGKLFYVLIIKKVVLILCCFSKALMYYLLLEIQPNEIHKAVIVADNIEAAYTRTDQINHTHLTSMVAIK